MSASNSSFFKDQILDSILVKQHLLEGECFNQLISMAHSCTEALQRGNKILVCGNGGSATDAQHIVGELVSRFYFDRPSLPAIALTANIAILTAIGNDYGYERVFARQVEGLGAKGDILIGISTSGSSKNVLAAFAAAKEKGITRFGLTGERKGPMNDHSELTLNVPSASTPRIQEAHILIGHLICAYIEEQIYGSYKPQA